MNQPSTTEFKEQFQKANLTDRLLFQHSLRPIHIIKPLIEGILRTDVGDINFLHDEMTQSVSVTSKDTRYDLLLQDVEGTLYDVEMENKGANIYERVDYYQAMLAVGSLEKGVSYKNLPKRKVIVISNFDPYGKGDYIYVIEPKVVKYPELDSGMKSQVIYLNLKGKHGWDELTPEVQEFVILAKDTTAETASRLTTPFAKDLFEQVTYVKNRVKQEEDTKMGFITDIMDAKDEGMAIALEIMTLFRKGLSINEIAAKTGASIDYIMQLLGEKA